MATKRANQRKAVEAKREEMFGGKRKAKKTSEEVALLEEDEIDEEALEEEMADLAAQEAEALEEEESEPDFDKVELPDGKPGTLKLAEIVQDEKTLASLNSVRWGSLKALKEDTEGHGKAEYERLRASIEEDGKILEPIGVYKPKGEKKYHPLYGFGRLWAGIQCDLEEVPVVIYPTSLSEAQRMSLQLQENSLAGQKRSLPWGKIVSSINKIVGGATAKVGKEQWEHLEKRFGFAQKTLAEMRRRYRLLPSSAQSEADLGRLPYNLAQAFIGDSKDGKKQTSICTNDEAKKIIKRALVGKTKEGKTFVKKSISKADLGEAMKHTLKAKRAKEAGVSSGGTRPSSRQCREASEYFLSLATQRKDMTPNTTLAQANKIPDEDIVEAPSALIAAGLLLSTGDIPSFPNTIEEASEAREESIRYIREEALVQMTLNLIREAGLCTYNRNGDDLLPWEEGYTQPKEEGKKEVKAIDHLRNLATKTLTTSPKVGKDKADTLAGKAIYLYKDAAKYNVEYIEEEYDEDEEE